MNEHVAKQLARFQKHFDGRLNAHWQRVFDRAHAIFVAAGCENDFCLQHAASGTIIFGGSNRLFWDRALNEFRASEAHCSEGFIRHVEMVKAGKS